MLLLSFLDLITERISNEEFCLRLGLDINSEASFYRNAGDVEFRYEGIGIYYGRIIYEETTAHNLVMSNKTSWMEWTEELYLFAKWWYENRDTLFETGSLAYDRLYVQLQMYACYGPTPAYYPQLLDYRQANLDRLGFRDHNEDYYP